MTTIHTQAPAPTPPRRRIPPAVTATAVLELALGSVTSAAGTVFSLQEGGGWTVAAGVFPVAFLLWWVGGIGLLRGSRRGWTTGLAMLGGLFCFGIYKIVWIHEAAAYPVQAGTLVLLAAHLAGPTRRWARR
jgi:hypothetical protein